MSAEYFEMTDYMGDPKDPSSWAATLERERAYRARRAGLPEPAPFWTPEELAKLREHLVRSRRRYRNNRKG
jgi:hypothetical protein